MKYYTCNFFEIEVYFTRLLGRFAPIYYFDCEQFFFVFIVKQTQNKVGGFYKHFWGDF